MSRYKRLTAKGKLIKNEEKEWAIEYKELFRIVKHEGIPVDMEYTIYIIPIDKRYVDMLTDNEIGKEVEFYVPRDDDRAVINPKDVVETVKNNPEYTWEDLAMNGKTPAYWIHIYKEWEELQTIGDIANWYASEFAVANRGRNEVREKLDIARKFLNYLLSKEDDDDKSEKILDILNKIK